MARLAYGLFAEVGASSEQPLLVQRTTAVPLVDTMSMEDFLTLLEERGMIPNSRFLILN